MNYILNKILVIAVMLSWAVTAIAQNYSSPEYFKEDYPASHRNKRVEAEKLFEEGKKEFEEGDYRSALSYFNESVALKPDHSMAYFFRGGAKEYLNDLKGAITDYDIVIHLDPSLSEAFFNRGNLRYKLGNYKGAIEDFNRLLAMPSPNTQAVYFKETSYGSSGPGASGIISMYSKDADIYNFLGLAKSKIGMYNEAIEDYNKALKLNGSEINYYINRGLAYKQLNQTEYAKDDFKRALEFEPENALALFNLSLISDGSNEDLKAYDHIVENNEDFPSAYTNRGLIKFRGGDYEGALSDYDEAARLDPDNPLVFLNRALSFEKLEKYSEAIKDLDRAIKLDPRLLKAYSSRGNVYFKLENWERALRDYNEAITLSANEAATFYNRALVKYMLKLNQEACLDLESAISQGYEAAHKALEAYCR